MPARAETVFEIGGGSTSPFREILRGISGGVDEYARMYMLKETLERERERSKREQEKHLQDIKRAQWELKEKERIDKAREQIRERIRKRREDAIKKPPALPQGVPMPSGRSIREQEAETEQLRVRENLADFLEAYPAQAGTILSAMYRGEGRGKPVVKKSEMPLGIYESLTPQQRAAYFGIETPGGPLGQVQEMQEALRRGLGYRGPSPLAQVPPAVRPGFVAPPEPTVQPEVQIGPKGMTLTYRPPEPGKVPESQKEKNKRTQFAIQQGMDMKSPGVRNYIERGDTKGLPASSPLRQMKDAVDQSLIDLRDSTRKLQEKTELDPNETLRAIQNLFDVSGNIRFMGKMLGMSPEEAAKHSRNAAAVGIRLISQLAKKMDIPQKQIEQLKPPPGAASDPEKLSTWFDAIGELFRSYLQSPFSPLGPAKPKGLDQLSDQELYERAMAGDRAAAEELARRAR